MDTTLLYFESIDFPIIFLALLFSLPTLIILFRGEGAFSDREWIIFRATLLIPIFVVVIGLLLFIHHPGFTSVRLIYYVGASVYPLIGLFLLLIMKKRKAAKSWKTRGVHILGMLCLGLLPLAFWMTFVEPRWMDITTTRITTQDGVDKEPIRIVVLTDIQTDHFGEWEDRIIEEANALHPDIILIPGDLLQATKENYAEELVKANRFLNALNAKHGSFIVQGDADRKVQDYDQSKVELLFNTHRTLTIRGRRIRIGGTELNYEKDAVKRAIERAEESPIELNIIFAHRPMTATIGEVKTSAIDLFVAGHTHGGQISIPFFGPPITMSAVPRHIAVGGLGRLSGRQIYVSRGLGLERMDAPRLRLNCRPELALLIVN